MAPRTNTAAAAGTLLALGCFERTFSGPLQPRAHGKGAQHVGTNAGAPLADVPAAGPLPGASLQIQRHEGGQGRQQLLSVAVGAAGGTLASAAVLSAKLRRARGARAAGTTRRKTRLLATPAPAAVAVDSSSKADVTPEEAAAAEAARYDKAKAYLQQFNMDDLKNLKRYPLVDLEELYVDAKVCFYQVGNPIMEDDMYDKLKATLLELDSPFPKLSKEEVLFVEASIAYYRGKPIVTNDDYKKLKQNVKTSGRRKDLTDFVMKTRSKQFLTDVQLKKMQEAFKFATSIDFSKLEEYPLGDLEELYIDALWCYYREGRPLLSDKDFDQVKQVLYKQESAFPTLSREEVAFVEAAINYYRGEPIMPDEEYESLKRKVQSSGKRKDVTAFLLYERGERFLDDEQFQNFKEEYTKLGLAPVNLDECTLAQMEEMYIDAVWAYHKDGTQLLSDGQYTKLKQELQFQGSGFPTLRSYEVDFVKASLAYWRGEPVVDDEAWQEIKRKVQSESRRKDVTAFLLYSKGQELLDDETFEKMKDEMRKLGLDVKKAGTKALEQTLSITSDQLKNDLGQVFFMVGALALLPTILCTLIVWALGLFLDFEFVPEPEWTSVLTQEFVPFFAIGGALGVLLTSRVMVFLDLQNPVILTGQCPSCNSDIKTFIGGESPPKEMEYRCSSCGCKMVLDTERKVIDRAGLGAKIEGSQGETDFNSAWGSVKERTQVVTG